MQTCTKELQFYSCNINQNYVELNFTYSLKELSRISFTVTKHNAKARLAGHIRRESNPLVNLQWTFLSLFIQGRLTGYVCSFAATPSFVGHIHNWEEPSTTTVFEDFH